MVSNFDNRNFIPFQQETTSRFLLKRNEISVILRFRWMMEKYNGIRVFWNGTSLQTAHSKKPIQVPSSLLSQFPNVAFEAEFWYDFDVTYTLRCGYNSTNTLNILKSSDWSKAKLMVFDCPLKYAENFEDRMKLLRESIQFTVLMFTPQRYSHR